MPNYITKSNFSVVKNMKKTCAFPASTVLENRILSSDIWITKEY